MDKPDGKGIQTMSKGVSNWEHVLEDQAEKLGGKPFLYLVSQDRYVSYLETHENASRIANYLLEAGAGPGDGLATLMGNSQAFLDLFFGIQRVGMYITPVNTALRGDGLSFIVDNSDARFLVVDYDLMELCESVEKEVSRIEYVIVNTLEAPDGFVVPDGMLDLRDAYRGSVSCQRPRLAIDEDSLLLLMYTSGTTGLPKGVVSRYNRNMVDRIRPLTRLMLREDSVYYTALPLFHGNALFVTMTQTLLAGCTMALSKRFSASSFWDEIHGSKATHFNTIGAIIPILLKQPERPCERNHNVQVVLSAGCPAELWEPFENRFNVELWEAYAAVDGSGLIMNFGNAPKGSIGKPVDSAVKLVDEAGEEVHPGEPGELLFKVAEDRPSCVEYYRNPAASLQKTRGEWEHTGDLMVRDEEGFLYFVGRKTDSMRRRGENVSAFEVEREILKHPSVLECAVFGVPSEMTEDEIMACVRLVEGKKLGPKRLWDFLKPNLASFAVPRYVRIVNEFPRTETFRIKKQELKAMGITPDTFDAEKEHRQQK
jgi:crotonobetaine/carnitine-CoA ligase